MIKVESLLVPGAGASLVEKFSTKTLIEDWRSTFSIDISGELRGIDEIGLYRCGESGLDFFLPGNAAGGPELYKNLQKFEWFYIPEKWEFDEAIKDLCGVKKLLEVGCGQGFFIEKAAGRLKCSIKGIEYSDEAVQKARMKKLPVEKMNLNGLIERGELFDAVCSFQVLEHVSEPRGFLESMVKVLEPGGRLIMCVPNKDSFLKNEYNLLDMPPHHMTRWNLASLRYLENLFPLKLERSALEPLAEYHVGSYVSSYMRLLHKKVPFSRFVFPGFLSVVFSAVLTRTGVYRRLRGQSVYVMYRKI